MQARLTLGGFRVTCAEDGIEALARVRASQPDAVMSDILMPRLDGFRLCLAIRNDPQIADVPIVLVTSSFLEEQDKRLAHEVGASAFVPRTPDFEEAITALRSSLGREPPRPSAQTTLLEEQTLSRTIRRLEHQAALGARLSQRCSMQAAALSVLSGIAETLAATSDVKVVLGEVLARCVDAGGMSLGALYLAAADGRLRLQASSGYAESARAALAACFGQEELLQGIIRNGVPVAIPSPQVPADAARSCLEQAGIASAVIVPIVSHGDRLGALLLGSRGREWEEQDWLSFARTVAAQVGQAVALAGAFSRVAASEKRYRDLMEHANDGILVLDRHGRIFEVNRRLEEMAGRPRAEVLGQSYHELLPPSEREEFSARFAQLLVEGSIRSDGRHLLRGDGGLVTVDLSSALVNIDGEPVVLTVLRDATDRERAREALQTSTRMFEGLFESSPDAIVVTNREGRIQRINARAEAVFGYRREELLGKPIETLIPSHLRERHVGLRAGYLASPRARQMGAGLDLHARRKDGSEFPTDVSLSPLETEEGLLITAVVRDLTERQRLDESLRASEARYRSLFDRNLAGVYGTTLEGRILECNEAFARIYGYASREEVLRLQAVDLHAAAMSREAFVARLKAEGTLVNLESEGRRKDGKPVWILENVVLVDATPPGLIEGTVVDITELKRLENQLRQAQKMEAIGQLAGGVAHDFNNLLGVIVGHSELLLRDIGPRHRGRRRVEQIRKASDRAAGLTRQLLAFSRKQVLQPKALDLNAVLAEIEKMLRRLIGEHIQLVTVFAEGLGWVMADPGQMEQVIVNLAVNARDAMPKGGKLILETARVELDEAYALSHIGAKPGPNVMLAVSDTGHGMDAETLSHIFEPFFTTKEEGKGTGLGLATVYGIVQQSGGHIAVYSEVGLGSTFKIYLPRVERRPAAVPAPARPKTPKGGSETILLAEDDSALRDMVREILERGGYTVLAGERPEDILQTALSHAGPIHLMLTDVVMPRMSGRDLAARIQAQQPGMRVLYMSGYTDEAISQHGILEPGIHFIEKPFAPESLLRKVREALDATG